MKVDSEQISTPPDGRPAGEQPAWRQDFPVDVPQDNYIARRDFTKFLVLTSGAFVAGQLFIAGKTAQMQNAPAGTSRKIGSINDVPVGGAFTFSYPEAHDPCILLRPQEGELVAYSQKCTHLSCAVVPDKERNCLHCPCHNGNFEISSGKPISGPPRRPLPRIHIELRGTEIWATSVEAPHGMNRDPKQFTRAQRLTIVYGILGIVMVLVILQLWLLTATMNAYLGGDFKVVWPACIASVVCLLLNVGLLKYLYGLER